ncbi:MAG: hypothetical protein ACOCRO_09435 [Halanaerobiales bacterium]
MKKERKRRQYHERKRKGLCPECGGQREDLNYIKCKSCRDMGNISQIKHYSDYKQRNLCPNCGTPTDKSKFVYCKSCRMKMSEQKRKERCL